MPTNPYEAPKEGNEARPVIVGLLIVLFPFALAATVGAVLYLGLIVR